MHEVLISIQPMWCEKIKHIIGQKGTKSIYEKTVEIRKTRPKIDTPFKCYIYETKGFYKGSGGCLFNGRGKVIGEFVCDRVQPFESEFVDDDCYENIASLDYDEDGDVTGFIEWSNDGDIPYESTHFYKKCCVKYEELKKYMGYGINQFYAWHISDLVIYDESKELSEFCRHDNTYDNAFGHVFEDRSKQIPLSRPPQSWCYVELLKGGAE